MFSFLILNELNGHTNVRVNLNEIESYYPEAYYVTIQLKTGRIFNTEIALEKLDTMFKNLGYTFKNLHEKV